MRSLQRERFDTDAVIEQVGRDPVKLCAWVRSQTQFVPYQGALRGPRGVLMDRVGNDLDRALLLARLVLSSGYEARLARLGLTANEAKQRLAAAGGAKLPEINRVAPAAKMIALLDRAARQTQQLSALALPAFKDEGWEAQQLQSAQDHWWVQYNDGQRWLELDPAVSREAPPAHLGAGAPATFVCTLPDLSARIPPELFHIVNVQVVVERWEDGRLVEDSALSWAVKTWDDPAIHIYLLHSFPTAPEVDAAGKDGQKLKAALLQDTTWRPLLMVNGRYRGPKTFDDTGVLTEAPIGGAVAVGNKVQSGFGGLAGATGSVKAKPVSLLTAEWLDVTVKTPGYPPQLFRREVFDSIGPATRASVRQAPLARPMLDDAARLQRGLALSGTNDNLIASCRYSIDYLLHHRARRLRDAHHDLLRALADPLSAVSRELIQRHLDPDWLEMMNVARALGPDSQPVYIDRPNICRLIEQREITADASVRIAAISDQPAGSVAALAPSGAERFAATMHRGVADTLCEEIAVGRVARPAGERTIRTTADAFDAAGQPPWIMLRDPMDPTLAAMPLSADARQRVIDDLAAGNIVVIPKEAIGGRFAWWRVDPHSGRTIGVMDTGFCADTAEYNTTHIPEAGLERTLTTRHLFPRTPTGDVARLAHDIIEFRQPGSLLEMLDCWTEAFDILGVATF